MTNGRDDPAWAAFLRLYRTRSPQEQRAFIDALIRVADGQPEDDAAIEARIELGDTRAEARQKVRAAGQKDLDWRRLLD